MTFADAFKLLGLGIEIDHKTRTWDLILGPLKIKDVPFATPNLLVGDRRMIGSLLSDCFLERRVMWKDFRQETLTECLSSLSELTALLAKNIETLQSSEANQDKVLAEA